MDVWTMDTQNLVHTSIHNAGAAEGENTKVFLNV